MLVVQLAGLAEAVVVPAVIVGRFDPLSYFVLIALAAGLAVVAAELVGSEQGLLAALLAVIVAVLVELPVVLVVVVDFDSEPKKPLLNGFCRL